MQKSTLKRVIPQLLLLSRAMRLPIETDECGDPVIKGQRGNVHTDGTGFSVYVSLKKPSSLNKAISALHQFSCVKQRGDTEAVLFVDLCHAKCIGALLRRLLKRPKPRKHKASLKQPRCCHCRTKIVDAVGHDRNKGFYCGDCAQHLDDARRAEGGFR